MDYRPLGRTGVSVSQLCLGAMMFGAFGNPDHDASVKIIHRALDAVRRRLASFSVVPRGVPTRSRGCCVTAALCVAGREMRAGLAAQG